MLDLYQHLLSLCICCTDVWLGTHHTQTSPLLPSRNTDWRPRLAGRLAGWQLAVMPADSGRASCQLHECTKFLSKNVPDMKQNVPNL